MSQRITPADRQLLARMEAEIHAAQRLQAFVTAHLSAVYELRVGDQILDGEVVRASVQAAPDQPPEQQPGGARNPEAAIGPHPRMVH